MDTRPSFPLPPIRRPGDEARGYAIICTIEYENAHAYIHSIIIWQPLIVQVSCSWDGTVKIWDLTLSQPVCTLEGHPDTVYDISCSPTDPRLIATCGRKGALILWDIAAKGMLYKSLGSISPCNHIH